MTRDYVHLHSISNNIQRENKLVASLYLYKWLVIGGLQTSKNGIEQLRENTSDIVASLLNQCNDQVADKERL